MQWLWRNKIHFLVWGVFAVYALTASQLYAAFFLNYGKPLKVQPTLPGETVELRAEVDDFRSIFHDGEEVYELSGWVFAPGISDSGQYAKKLVLHSVQRDLVFQAEMVNLPGLNNELSRFNMPVENAGFRVLIAKDVLRMDNYKIGFILEDEGSGRRVYGMLDKYIEREPNSLRFVDGY